MITVLRLGHRRKRDARVSTHCGLVARAFGANGIVYSGEEDRKLVESIKKVIKNWGRPFYVSYEKNWRKVILRNKKATKVHLTMYGIPLEQKIREIRKKKNILLIVGGEKVPGEVYKLSDYNISVTNQPHSEVAAMAVFLHEYFAGKELKKKFSNAKIRVLPSEKGKIVKGI